MAIVGASSPSFVDKMLVAVGLIYEGRYYYGRHGRLVVVLETELLLGVRSDGRRTVKNS